MSKIRGSPCIDNKGIFLIVLEGVGKKYKNKDLFYDVNIKIDSVGIHCFIGENGVGKTTLLNIISLVIPPSCGNVVNRFKKCSFVSQKVNLIENLTVEEHFKMLNIDCNLLKQVHLFSKRKKYPKELSLGMKQRVAVLLGLYVDNYLVVLDEPTSHLDSYNSALLMNEIKRVSKRKIVLLVSHDDKIVHKYSDYIYEIKDKKVLLIKSKEERREVSDSKSRIKRFGIYLKKRFMGNKKTNLCYFLLCFFLFFLLGVTVNLKGNLLNLLNSDGVLDYNKFYLKECKNNKQGKLVIKECGNLSLENIELLEESEHLLSLNYDVFLNDLYNIDNINVVYTDGESLKSGRYPRQYNEVVVSGGYSLGDEIVIEANKVIRGDKVDVFNNKLVLRVVGICRGKPFIRDNNIYLDYTLIEEYLKGIELISNEISLYEYFKKAEINNYKYVLYFNKMDFDILKENDIEYLSLSYDYFQELEVAFNDVIDCMSFISIFMFLTSFFYIVKLIRKRVRNIDGDIIFFRSMGISKRKIVNILNKENVVMIMLGGVVSYICVYWIFSLFIQDVKLSIAFCFFLLLFGYISKVIIELEVKRKVSI